MWLEVRVLGALHGQVYAAETHFDATLILCTCVESYMCTLMSIGGDVCAVHPNTSMCVRKCNVFGAIVRVRRSVVSSSIHRSEWRMCLDHDFVYGVLLCVL